MVGSDTALLFSWPYVLNGSSIGCTVRSTGAHFRSRTGSFFLLEPVFARRRY